MKKLFFLVVMLTGLFAATQMQAQNATLLPLQVGDTLVMSTSSDTVTKVIRATAGYSALGIQANVTKLSGTVAGKAYLWSSLDGTNYVLTDSSAAFTDQTTNIAQFTKLTTPFTHYRVMVKPTGGNTATYSAIVRVWYVVRKHD